MVDHVAKPVRPEALQAALARHLDDAAPQGGWQEDALPEALAAGARPLA